MRLQKRNERRAAFLLLLLLILGIHWVRVALPAPGAPVYPCREMVYVQIGGEVSRPGVYGFCSPPSPGELVSTAEGRRDGKGFSGMASEPGFRGGDRVLVRRENGRESFTRGEMPGFYKVTLGIPLSLNRETAAGLSSLPGIGPGLAALIVEERSRRAGFRSLEELTTVRGIGRQLFMKVKPHLVL